MDPRTYWSKFRQLPTWAQAIAWLFAWPVLGGLAIWKSNPTGTAARAGAAAVLLVGGLAWFPAMAGAGGDGNTPAAAEADDEDDAEAAGIPEPVAEATTSPDDEPSPAPTPTPVPTPTPTPSPSPSPSPSPTVEAATAWTVTNIVDGDTIDVMAADGTVERIRVIGIDTPERGECGFAEASDELAILILNEKVELVAGARDDRDRYDRLLRYVDVDGLDAGLALIKEGLAIARYDSRDGYGRHPREGEYVEVDASTEHLCAAPAPKPSPTKTQAPAPPPPPPPTETEDDTTASNPWGTSSCDPAYDPCVPPKSEVGDLNCPDIKKKYPSGVSVNHAHGDPHRLDGDKDGRGCE